MWKIRTKLPHVLKNSTLYSLVSFFQKGMGFILLPLYTTYLTPNDYGTINIINSVTAFLSILILMSLHGAATRFHFKSNDRFVQAQVWGTILILIIINSLFWGVIFLVFHKYIVDPITNNIAFWPLVGISIINVTLNPLYILYQQWLQTNQLGKKYSINLLLNFILCTILNISLLSIFNLGALGVILASFFTSIVYFIYSAYKLIPQIKLTYNSQIAKEAFKYSLPLIPHSISGYMAVMIDRILLNKLVGTNQVGLYSVANQFGTILNTITTSVNNAFTPWAFNIISKENNYKKIYLFSEFSIIIYCIIAFTITYFSPEVIKLMTSTNYSKAWEPIIFICYGYVLNGFYYFLSMPLFYYKSDKIFIISISQAIINIILNLLFIPKYGYIGAGLAFLCSQFFSTIITYHLLSKNIFHIKFNIKKTYSIILFFLLLSLMIFYFEYHLSFCTSLIIKTLILIIIISLTIRKYSKLFLKYFKLFNRL